MEPDSTLLLHYINPEFTAGAEYISLGSLSFFFGDQIDQRLTRLTLGPCYVSQSELFWQCDATTVLMPPTRRLRAFPLSPPVDAASPRPESTREILQRVVQRRTNMLSREPRWMQEAPRRTEHHKEVVRNTTRTTYCLSLNGLVVVHAVYCWCWVYLW